MATIIVGTNSWVTEVEADAYFEARLNASTVWSALTSPDKIILLISAFNWIRQQPGLDVAASETNEIVKQAQYETAWYMHNYFQDHEDRQALHASGVRDFELSDFQEQLNEPQFPAFVVGMLKDYITSYEEVFFLLDRNFDLNSSS